MYSYVRPQHFSFSIWSSSSTENNAFHSTNAKKEGKKREIHVRMEKPLKGLSRACAQVVRVSKFPLFMLKAAAKRQSCRFHVPRRGREDLI